MCIGLLLRAWSDCRTAQCWASCAVNIIKSLPLWAQILCGALCVGCLACLIAFLERATLCGLAKNGQLVCCNHPRTCGKGDTCATASSKLLWRSCCLDARIAVGEICYGGIDPAHRVPILDELKGVLDCLADVAIKCHGEVPGRSVATGVACAV